MKPGFPFRVGDVVAFGRGDNRYMGKVERLLPATPGYQACLRVDSEDVGGLCSVYVKDVLDLVYPVLTDKESAAIRALYEYGTLTVAEGQAVGLPLTGTVLRNLRDRGLVTDFREGVASTGVCSWQVSKEYEAMIHEIYYPDTGRTPSEVEA